MIKSSMQQEDITIITVYTIYVSNIRTSKYIKQILADVKEKFNLIMYNKDYAPQPRGDLS